MELSSQWRGVSKDQYIKFGQAYPNVIGAANFHSRSFNLPVRIEYRGHDVKAQYYAQQLFGLFGFSAIMTLMSETFN